MPFQCGSQFCAKLTAPSAMSILSIEILFMISVRFLLQTSHPSDILNSLLMYFIDRYPSI